MRTASVYKYNGVVCCAVVALVAGYQMAAGAGGPREAPYVLQADEQIVRDQLIILVDQSATIGSGSLNEQQRELAHRFTMAMPDGYYLAGLKSFAGVHSMEWVQYKLAPFNRADMVEAAERLQPLGRTTPLEKSIYHQRSELKRRGGHGALLIFSDGRVTSHEAVLDAARDIKAAHGGELCIFTVQVGDSEDGKRLLQDLANVNGCGKYYEASTLDSSVAMHGMVRDVLVGHQTRIAVAPAPRDPLPAIWSLENVLFKHDIDVVHPMYNAQLDEVARAMRNTPEARLRLHGHTDSDGSNAYNDALSERRVSNVKAALVQRGVDPSRIETRRHGETSPQVPNNTSQNKHTNRRVELIRVQ